MTVAVVGVGYTDFRSATPDVTFKEQMFEAAVKAYTDAGVSPRKDIGSFITGAEDYWEGYSIFDEFVPDQLGATLRPVCTISGDGLQALMTGVMQVETGMFDIVAIEAHSKASDMLSFTGIVSHGLDPVYNRSMNVSPFFVAGLEMRKYLSETKTTREQCARVVVKNKKNALDNPLAAYPASMSVDEVMNSEMVSDPLSRRDLSPLADGAIVFVLASEKRAKELSDYPIWLKGLSWISETPWLESRNWSEATYAKLASKKAYKMAGIIDPKKQLDLVEVDDWFSYKELQHLEAIGICEKGQAGKLLEQGKFDRNGETPVNVSGGRLGAGNLLEASSLQSVLECVLQLRGHAGKRQIKNARTAAAQSWRGIPTATGSMLILSNEK
ncbi:MAG: thiolase C-terminal domain-containing protein [Candidatus Thorarchaeota archaeon SMTZ1-45]|nr:MAG: acetyl-CoA acetyltransferase [Candidatus Thorarchaeota archaeon SMTZ1-45]